MSQMSLFLMDEEGWTAAQRGDIKLMRGRSFTSKGGGLFEVRLFREARAYHARREAYDIFTLYFFFFFS